MAFHGISWAFQGFLGVSGALQWFPDDFRREPGSLRTVLGSIRGFQGLSERFRRFSDVFKGASRGSRRSQVDVLLR